MHSLKHRNWGRLLRIFRIQIVFIFVPVCLCAQDAVVTIDVNTQHQVIDGFGAHQGNEVVNEEWWQELYYGDLEASILRMDLTPRLTAPYADFSYYSPWFMGSQTDHILNLEDLDNPDGPEGNRVRTYTGPGDYSRNFGGYNAPIAVMGPDIDKNISYFTYNANGAITEGIARKEELGDFKLTGSLWSPVPWVKESSGNTYGQNWWPGPVINTPWPFIWGGNFAGGQLDVSDTPLEIFNDSDLGGDGPTSALTQFARSTAAYIKGFQQFHGIEFYAVSIQNELNFEQFYNSTTYPLASMYVTALKAIRAEFDKDSSLRDIKIMGPEDLLGGDAYGMWQYGGGSDPTHKNLQYLAAIAQDPEAMEAIDFFCIHGYDSDGISASGATSTLWDWWVNGWEESPAPGIPANVAGFASQGKKCWMTETSGENPNWLWPQSGFPGDGGWGLALRIHQALTAGQQSAWIYWTFTESDDDNNVTPFALTNAQYHSESPKYLGAKHFFKYIRPGAFRVGSEGNGSEDILSSAYFHPADSTITVVLLNTNSTPNTAEIQIQGMTQESAGFDLYSTSYNSNWQHQEITFSGSTGNIELAGYSVATLTGKYSPATSSAHSPETEAALQLQLMPNPTSTEAELKLHLSSGQYLKIALYNTDGRRLAVLRDGFQSKGDLRLQIRRKDLPAGIYYLHISDREGLLISKGIIFE